MRKTLVFLASIALLLTLSLPSTAASQYLMMATTTSTDNTGLLNVIAPAFEKATKIELRWTAVGTGKALELGKNCDVDVLLVHAPDKEKKFIEERYGINRREVMYNDFVIIGPRTDPAGIKGLKAIDTLKRIKSKKAPFVSRGDNSGTHSMELKLWEKANITNIDKEDWYIQTGQGMLNTINIAAERDGYTLTDRGTFIKYEANHSGNPPLVILVEGDQLLFNQYSVIAINPKRCHKVKYDLALKFIEWITSDEGQKLIADFRLMGKQLFVPNAAR